MLFLIFPASLSIVVSHVTKKKKPTKKAPPKQTQCLDISYNAFPQSPGWKEAAIATAVCACRVTVISILQKK